SWHAHLNPMELFFSGDGRKKASTVFLCADPSGDDLPDGSDLMWVGGVSAHVAYPSARQVAA
ncbi:MAG TPA: hypothetical protein VHH36_08240, partial [Candidatus Thermoplasmatota archaeon]|nr:hypothetical protein [Candidatus Thermoplasmatota archaeon]